MIAGCALFTPTVPVDPAQSQLQQQSQQISTALTQVTAIVKDIQAAKNTPAVVPVSPAAPSAVTSTTVTTPAAPAVPGVPAVPAATSTDTVDKVAQVLAILTPAVQQLNTNIQNAPTTQAQQQAAINTGIQTAQAAAVTFGGQYGTLIAAGIGIVSVLLQGMFNSSNAHKTAQQAQATSAAAVGARAGSGRFPIDGPANAAPK